MKKFESCIKSAVMIIITMSPALMHSTISMAQGIKKVYGEYSYYAPENISIEDAKRTALSRAQIQALANEFGTMVSQHNTTTMQNNNGQSSTDFTSLSSSDVKGEWIETTSGPEYEIAYQQGMLVVKCRISGKARELTSKTTEFIARVLRNGKDDRFESDSFRSGDDLFLSFQSSSDTYVAVYLIDNSNTAYCLLPYVSSKEGKVFMEANKKYILFSADNAASLCNPSEVDEYTMTCEKSMETNYIYVICSPNAFVKAIDNVGDDGLPRELTFNDFEKWLTKNRNRDKDMQVDIKTITITK